MMDRQHHKVISFADQDEIFANCQLFTWKTKSSAVGRRTKKFFVDNVDAGKQTNIAHGHARLVCMDNTCLYEDARKHNTVPVLRWSSKLESCRPGSHVRVFSRLLHGKYIADMLMRCDGEIARKEGIRQDFMCDQN